MQIKTVPAYEVDLGNGEKLTYRTRDIANKVAAQYQNATVDDSITHIAA